VNSDIRLCVTFKGHRKRRKLTVLLGDGATDYLIDLWLSAAQDRPDGILTGWAEVDISLAAGWSGDPHKFISALTSTGLLDDQDGIYSLHDWSEHQPWACKAQQRTEAARRSANARWKQCGTHAERMRGADKTQCGTHAESCPSAPSPSPSPSPEKRVMGGVGEAPDGATPDDLNPLEEEILNLQSWGKLTEADRQWVAQFTGDYPKTTVIDIRDCRDYWMAKTKPHNAKVWKSRLRNWMKHKDTFGGNGATNRQGARGLPTKYTPAPINTRPLLKPQL